MVFGVLTVGIIVSALVALGLFFLSQQRPHF
jgi:hypothetical protein